MPTIHPVSPIHTDEELTQAHLRLDKLIATQAHHSPDQTIRDEFEVLTALIFYYEQRARFVSRIEDGIRQSDNGEILTEAEAKSYLSRWLQP